MGKEYEFRVVTDSKVIVKARREDVSRYRCGRCRNRNDVDYSDDSVFRKCEMIACPAALVESTG